MEYETKTTDNHGEMRELKSAGWTIVRNASGAKYTATRPKQAEWAGTGASDPPRRRPGRPRKEQTEE